MGLVDAHCHFDFPVFDGRRALMIEAAAALGIDRIVIPGVQRRFWRRAALIAESHRGLFYCLGIHPWFVGAHNKSDLEALRVELSRQPERCVALGECGLDRLTGSLEQQYPWFEAQVEIARDLDLPLVIHSVKAHDEVAAVLKRKQFPGRALVHGFAGSAQQARTLIDLGCFIGVGGIITHERARKTRATVAGLPLESLVLETDAPDMAPAGVPKGKNSPEYLVQVFQALAALRPESPDELLSGLAINVGTLYRWA